MHKGPAQKVSPVNAGGPVRVIAKLILTTLICVIIAGAAQQISGIWSARRAVQLTDQHRLESLRLRQQLTEATNPAEKALIRYDAQQANRVLSEELQTLNGSATLPLLLVRPAASPRQN